MPTLGGRGFDGHIADPGLFSPAEFGDVLEVTQQIPQAGVCHHRSSGWNLPQGPPVEVIHVAVGDQQRVEPR